MLAAAAVVSCGDRVTVPPAPVAEECSAASPCLPDARACFEAACVDGRCEGSVRGAGTSCDEDGGRYCDGAGTCVECIEDGHCSGGDVCDPVRRRCVPPQCVDGERGAGETDVDCGGPCPACDDGQGCMAGGDCVSLVCERGACQAPRCGDGVVHDGEACDDGNDALEDDCPSGPDGTCQPAFCGDGFVHAGEECDDGNAEDADDCLSSCVRAVCGDGIVNALGVNVEECDDGNADDDDDCLNVCTIARCGDGVIHDGGSGSELCDDGNLDTHDDCPDGPTGSCVPASCEDGFIHDQGGGDETDVDCGGSCLACPDGLLLNELATGPAGGAFVEIRNRSLADVNLAHVYLADYGTYYGLAAGTDLPGAGDFRLRFPAGSVLPAEGRIVVALGSASAFVAERGTQPDYDLDPTDPGAPAMLGEQGVAPALDAEGMLVLFSWDGESELVRDLDYVAYGGAAAAMDKSGVTVGTSSYLPDTPVALQDVAGAPSGSESLGRCNPDEGFELALGGNGYSGNDETSENMSRTWEVWDVVTPGLANRCGGGFLWGKAWAGLMSDPWRSPVVKTSSVGSPVFVAQLAGSVGGPSSTNSLLAQFDASGNHAWSISASGGTLQSVDLDPADNVALAGGFAASIDVAGTIVSSAAPNDATLLVAKLTPTGQTIWARGVDDVVGSDVATTPAGDVVTVGYNDGSSFTFGDAGDAHDGFMAIAMLSGNDGSHIWSRSETYASGQSMVERVAVDAAGDVYIAGHGGGTLNFGGPGDEIQGSDSFVVKLSGADGSHVWSRYISGFSMELVHDSIALGADGHVYLAGRGGWGGHLVVDGQQITSSLEAVLIKLNGADGSLVWARAGSGGGTMTSVATNAAGEVVVAGAGSGDFSLGEASDTPLPVNSAVAFVTKLSAADGAHRWTRFGRATQSVLAGPDVGLAPDGTVHVVGHFEAWESVNFGFAGDALTAQGSASNLYLVALQP